MNFFEKLFSEKSDISCMRFMSVLSLVVGSAIAFISLAKGNNLSNDSSTIAIFVGAAFGGKVGQKFAEGKGTNDADKV